MAGISSIEGLISGLNTSQIIEDLMAIEHRPVDLLEDRRTAKQTELSAWQQINTLLLSLKTQSETLLDEDLYELKQATSSDNNILTANASSSAALGAYSLTINSLATSHQLSSQGFPTSNATNIGNGNFSLRSDSNAVINLTLGQDSGINTLGDVADAINDANAGITATIINTGAENNPYQLILTADEVGEANAISFGISIFGGWNLSLSTIQDAADAELVFGGVSGITITRGSNTISDLIDGITLYLKEADPSTTVTVKVQQSAQQVQTELADFVARYNASIAYIDAQFEYDQETKKGGILLGNNSLLTIQQGLKDRIVSFINSEGDTKLFSEIGITFNDDGTLNLSLSTLTNALEADFENVKTILAGDGSDNSGIVANISNYLEFLTDPYTGIIDNRIGSLNDQIEDISSQINSLEERLELRQARLEKDFVNLETILSELQTQSTYLESQLSTLTSNWSFTKK